MSWWRDRGRARLRGPQDEDAVADTHPLPEGVDREAKAHYRAAINATMAGDEDAAVAHQMAIARIFGGYQRLDLVRFLMSCEAAPTCPADPPVGPWTGPPGFTPARARERAVQMGEET